MIRTTVQEAMLALAKLVPEGKLGVWRHACDEGCGTYVLAAHAGCVYFIQVTDDPVEQVFVFKLKGIEEVDAFVVGMVKLGLDHNIVAFRAVLERMLNIREDEPTESVAETLMIVDALARGPAGSA